MNFLAAYYFLLITKMNESNDYHMCDKTIVKNYITVVRGKANLLLMLYL